MKEFRVANMILITTVAININSNSYRIIRIEQDMGIDFYSLFHYNESCKVILVSLPQGYTCYCMINVAYKYITLYMY